VTAEGMSGSHETGPTDNGPVGPTRSGIGGSIVKAVVLIVVFAVVGTSSAFATFRHSERQISIGAHHATVQPTFSGHATLDAGPLLPKLRLPIDEPLNIGLTIHLGDSDVQNLSELTARDAVIASQPRGEIEKVAEVVNDMAVDAALRGLGSGALAVIVLAVGWYAVGRERRDVLWRRAKNPSALQVLGTSGLVMIVGAALFLVVVPETDRSAVEPTQWRPLRAVYPEIPDEKILDNVEVSVGAAGRGSSAIVQGMLDTYRTSLKFYGELADKAEKVDVRRPRGSEKTALVVTDRHDNIGMDPVARAIGDRADISMLFDLGDDTSVGGRWEEFSLNSLAREFKNIPTVAVPGNHDHGSFVRKQMLEKGFTVLNNRPETVYDIRFIGGPDPRSSGLTGGYTGQATDNTEAIHEQDELLTRRACADGRVSVALLHSSASARELTKSGCVDLVLTGHLHRQVGPNETTGANGRTTVSMSTGSTGGAVYAFALGSKLRRPAQVTVVTFDEGRPVGIQPVDITTGGEIEAQQYRPIDVSDRDAPLPLTPTPTAP